MLSCQTANTAYDTETPENHAAMKQNQSKSRNGVTTILKQSASMAKYGISWSSKSLQDSTLVNVT